VRASVSTLIALKPLRKNYAAKMTKDAAAGQRIHGDDDGEYRQPAAGFVMQ
jgi:hypothetical protein